VSDGGTQKYFILRWGRAISARTPIDSADALVRQLRSQKLNSYHTRFAFSTTDFRVMEFSLMAHPMQALGAVLKLNDLRITTNLRETGKNGKRVRCTRS